MYSINYRSDPDPDSVEEGYCVINKDKQKISDYFSDEFQAFDYIKTQLEPDEKYKQYTGFPEMFIMEMYRTLTSDGKKRILRKLVQEYKENVHMTILIRRMKCGFRRRI